MVAVATVLSACGGKDEAPAALPDPSALAAVPAPEPAPPAHPETEEALVTAFTAAIEARDIAAVKRLVGPELGADLERMHGADEGAFWGRAGRWVEHAKHGFEVAYRQEPDTEERWRALVKFGDGAEERVT